MPTPTISIVVPSFNQGAFLAEALQSLVDQEYERLEVVIQDPGSKDGSIEIAQRFVERHPSMFRLFVERDDGQADALNRGFARTTGEILGYLNSDDTLLPRILHRVAVEIDPARKRWVVMGRCVFTGEGSRYVGVEHPSSYRGHFDHLAIWKRGYNTIPQPSVFWHRVVWDRCGQFDVNERHALDYELFCRFSRLYAFHAVDEIWSTYRMHDASKSANRTEAEVLDLSIQASRKHWGSPLRPLRWRCELSHWLYSQHFHDHARHHARRAEGAFRERRYIAALRESLATLVYSPRMARQRLLYAFIARKHVGLLERFLVRPPEFDRCYPDSWIGPVYRETLDVAQDATRLNVRLSYHPQPRHLRVRVNLIVAGKVVDTQSLSAPAQFVLTGEISSFRGTAVPIEVRSSSYFVPSDGSESKDDRRLSLLFLGSTIDRDPSDGR